MINHTGDMISAEDLDMWGYRMTDRSFQSDTTFYKYTGKERDKGTGYDYFGARYYDSRIGRWGQVEPLLDDFVSTTPYSYCLDNPIRLVDDDGNKPRDGFQYQDPKITIQNATIEIKNRIISGYDKLFSGDFSGAIDQAIDNTLNSPRLVGDLIPSDLATNLMNPSSVGFGLIKTSKGFMFTPGARLMDESQELAKILGKNRIYTSEGALDLAVRPGRKPYHIIKLGGGKTEKIYLPHLHPYSFRFNRARGLWLPTYKDNAKSVGKKEIQKVIDQVNYENYIMNATSLNFRF